MQAVAGCYNKSIEPIIMLAIQTGLRRSELLDLTWRCVDLERRLAHIPRTKTGKPRTVPLTDEACTILCNQPRNGDRIFYVSPTALRLAWGRIMKRAGLLDLRFHDLRHEAISRFFELGLSLPEVALISGHRDPRMLFRYTHLRPENVAQKLAGKSWAKIAA
jgi:integrase